MTFNFGLETVLEEIDETRNSIAVESKVRPATVHDLFNGSTKRIELPTIQRILDAINEIARKKGITKTYTLNDIIGYTYEKDAQQ